jgi:hypothetical protein
MERSVASGRSCFAEHLFASGLSELARLRLNALAIRGFTEFGIDLLLPAQNDATFVGPASTGRNAGRTSAAQLAPRSPTAAWTSVGSKG